MLTVGSCFSGIGGLELGLEWTGGFKTKWQIEIDDYASRVLAKHWPDVKRYQDIERVNFLREVDVVCGGFPCQDISDAGHRAGITGERSGLWRELMRTIRMVRPRFAIVENVAALLRRGMGTVLGDLAEGGYDSEWDCVSAHSVGAPHLRERVFIVADSEGSRRRQGHSNSGTTSQGTRAPREWCGPSNGYRWQAEPEICRVDDGTARRVDRLRCLGNAVVPQVAEKIGEMILGMGNR